MSWPKIIIHSERQGHPVHAGRLGVHGIWRRNVLSDLMVRGYLGRLGVGDLAQAALPDLDRESEAAGHVAKREPAFGRTSKEATEPQDP